MSNFMYDASIPVFQRFLKNLDSFLERAEKYAEQKKFDATVLVRARLAPDMFDLARQVQIAADMAKGCAARLTGAEPPKFDDNEATIGELRARIKKTLDYVGSVDRKGFDGSETRDIVLPMRDRTLEFKGQDYLLGWVLPNFYFHVTAAYAILRHNGLELGKMDFLAS
jgi:hypothetical protein